MTHGDRFQFDDFVLDVKRRTVSRAGRVRHVQPKTFDLLRYLVCHPDRLITREELLDAVWRDQVVTDSAVARAVREVRKVLNDDAANPRFLETVQRTGYRFICPVKRMGPTRRPSLWTAGLSAAGVLFIVLIGLVAILRFDFGADAGSGAESSDGRAPPHDVAALNAERFYRVGLDRFSRRGPKAATEAEKHFLRALETDPRHAGAMAGLAVVRILQLPRPLTTPEALRVAKPLTDRALEINPEEGLAYAALGLAYMQDRHYEEAEAYLQQAVVLDPDLTDAYTWLATVYTSDGRLLAGIEAYRAALLKNPAHSSAVGNMAQLLIKAGRYAEAEELILSQSELPDARAAMAYARWFLASNRGDLAEAIRQYADSIEAHPDSTFAAAALGGLLAEVGLPEVGQPWIQRNLSSCDPRLIRAAVFWRLAGSPDRANDILRQWMRERDLPLHRAADAIQQELAVLAIQSGDLPAGIGILRRVFPEPGHVVGRQGDFTGPAIYAQYLAYALRASGSEAEALRYVAQIRAQAEMRRRNGYREYARLTLVEARNELLLGDPQKAVDLLRVAVDEGFRGLYGLRADPLWLQLEGRPDYKRVTDRIEAQLAAMRDELKADGTLDRLAELAERLPPRTCDLGGQPE